MFLFDNVAFHALNDRAVSCARRMVCAVVKATELAPGPEIMAFNTMTWVLIFAGCF